MQLVLPIALPLDQTFDSFYSAHVSSTVEYLKRLHSTEQGSLPLSVLTGNGGTGKSHLLFSLCHQYEHLSMESVYLDLKQMADLHPAMLLELEQLNLICLDNLEAIAGHGEWENAVFDLINRVNEATHQGAKLQLVIAMQKLPKYCDFALPDLLSRLNWGTCFTLADVNDQHREAIIKLRAKAQGFNISDAACRYLLTHTDRQLSNLMTLLEKLDEISLQAKKKITVTMLRALYAKL